MFHTRKIRAAVRDQFATFDSAAFDSAGAFLIGELERLDPMIHEPLVSVTWQRDIDLRTDVQMGDTSSSFTTSTFGVTGQPQPTGINWAVAQGTTLARPTVDITHIINPLDLWAMEVAYTMPELESARLLNRPIDAQQLMALNLKHQMDTDQLVYMGDSFKGTTGLFNNSLVTNSACVAAGATTYFGWKSKTPAEILADFNEVITSTWAASGYAVAPSKILVAPVEFGYIATELVSTAGNRSILDYVRDNNILTANTGKKLDINSVKWLDANNSGNASDRMVAYSQVQKFVRFPLVPVVPMAPQFQGIWVKVPYYGREGVVEVVYPETVAYRYGININSASTPAS